MFVVLPFVRLNGSIIVRIRDSLCLSDVYVNQRKACATTQSLVGYRERERFQTQSYQQSSRGLISVCCKSI